MAKIKKDDQIIVLSGKDRGKQGKVLRVLQAAPHKKQKKGVRKFNWNKLRTRIVIEGVNIVKKHVKPNPQANQQGGIIEKEAAMDISNVAIYNPISKKADKVGFKLLNDGKKVRIFRSTGELIDI